MITIKNEYAKHDIVPVVSEHKNSEILNEGSQNHFFYNFNY